MASLPVGRGGSRVAIVQWELGVSIEGIGSAERLKVGSEKCSGISPMTELLWIVIKANLDKVRWLKDCVKINPGMNRPTEVQTARSKVNSYRCHLCRRRATKTVSRIGCNNPNHDISRFPFDTFWGCKKFQSLISGLKFFQTPLESIADD